MNYFLYIIECNNHSYYTGYTTDIKRRYQEHIVGTSSCKYTKAFPPKKLAVYWNTTCSRSKILKAEIAIKKMTRTEKLALIQGETDLNFQLKHLDLVFNAHFI